MRPKMMNLDTLFAIGNGQRESNRACGMMQEGVDYLTTQWVLALWRYQGVPREVGDALLRRWGLPTIALLESERPEVDTTSDPR